MLVLDYQSRHALAAQVIVVCAALLVGAVAYNFARAPGSRTGDTQRRSPVATASMLAFFGVLTLVLKTRYGALPPPGDLLDSVLVTTGLALVMLGTAVNLLGRISLGHNWANEATLYVEQTLVTSGVYRLVRHPLYASLLWFGVGASLIHANPLALALMLGVFQPAMRWRATLEEEMLGARFPEYARYQARVGMFWPRLAGGESDE